jgi:hypothetical protein
VPTRWPNSAFHGKSDLNCPPAHIWKDIIVRNMEFNNFDYKDLRVVYSLAQNMATRKAVAKMQFCDKPIPLFPFRLKGKYAI